MEEEGLQFLTREGAKGGGGSGVLRYEVGSSFPRKEETMFCGYW